MAYEFYLGGIRFPVPPQKLKLKTKGQNETMTLINGNEINILNPPGLTEISFDVLLPWTEYPFAEYDGGFEPPEYFLSTLDVIKKEQKPVQFVVIRESPQGDSLFDTNMTVSLEDYTVEEDAKDSLDVTVSISLKNYIFVSTQKYEIQEMKEKEEAEVLVEEERDASNAPEYETYTVKKGDSLWNIAKRYLGSGSRYREVYNLNRDKIRDPNRIQIGQVLKMPEVRR